MEYRTIEGVELATVGMEWPASTGPYSCTFENLADAMNAANNDPHVMSPRIKIGHTSELNGELLTADPFANLGDGAPAFGRVVNLRLENDGAVLVGDFIEVPAWLGEALPSAYPSRSTEVRLAYTTEGGKQYSAVLTAVALLGPVEPAIKDLDDLERFLISGPQNVAAASRPEEVSMPEQVDASVASGTIRQRFNFGWAMDPDNGAEQDTYWWWARDVFIDPSEVIADDDDGNCWSVPFTTDGEDEITFGEPVRVRETFVPVNASAGAITNQLRQRTGQQVLASNLERPEKPAPKTAASTAQPDDEENEMTIDLDKLRGRLGLPDDATEDQINEALANEPETPAEPVVPTDEIPETPEVEASEPVAASADLPEGFVAVPADKWEQVQAGAIAGGDLATETETKRRDDTFTSACGVGKVAPADKDGLYTMHANPETRDRFYTLLTAEVKGGGLKPGLVPVTEIGEAGGDAVAASAALPWFPELNKEEK